MAITLGLDIGTTSTIGILIDTDGQTLALASRPVTLYSEHPGWAEEDPEAWWQNVTDIIPELLTKSGKSAADIAAIGVTGMLPAVVLLDGSKKLLRGSIEQSDGRVGRESRPSKRISPARTSPGGEGTRPRMASAPIGLPEPDSPTIATVSPAAML